MISTIKLQSLRLTSDPQTVKMALAAIAAITIIASLLFPQLALAEGATGPGHSGG